MGCDTGEDVAASMFSSFSTLVTGLGTFLTFKQKKLSCYMMSLRSDSAGHGHEKNQSKTSSTWILCRVTKILSLGSCSLVIIILSLCRDSTDHGHKLNESKNCSRRIIWEVTE